MTIGALNSGQINAVPFPQAEAGLSLIQLVGTVEVVGSISALYTRRVVGASTVASATVPDIVTTMRYQMTAAAAARAIGSTTELLKVTSNQAITPASALGSAGVTLKRRLTAAQSARAVVACGAVIKVKRTAAVSAVAASDDVAAQTKVPRTAAVQARAQTSAGALVKVSRSATTVARASATAKIKMILRATAATAPSALGTAATRNKRTTGATTTARAVTAATALRKIRFSATATPRANTLDAIGALRISMSAETVSSALGTSGVALKYNLGATTVARAVPSAAATDYGIAMPAPIERRMSVPPSERTMEVTE